MSDIEQEISTLNHWIIKDGALFREFRFRDFKSAFGFMTMIALEAERLNHHPDWKNSYNRIEIALFTHDENRITRKDIQLAKFINEIENVFQKELT